MSANLESPERIVLGGYPGATGALPSNEFIIGATGTFLAIERPFTVPEWAIPESTMLVTTPGGYVPGTTNMLRIMERATMARGVSTGGAIGTVLVNQQYIYFHPPELRLPVSY